MSEIICGILIFIIAVIAIIDALLLGVAIWTILRQTIVAKGEGHD